MTNNDKYMDSYFEKVDRYSEGHRKDLEKFSQLLEHLTGSIIADKDNRYKSEMVLFRDTIIEFEEFLGQQKITLSKTEKNNLSFITESAYTPIVKKRMAEDLIHKIRKRFSDERNKNLAKTQIENEIDEIRKSKRGIADWFRITKFALSYGTITFFSHKLKDISLSIIRNKVFSWQKTIETNINFVLDKKYYILSTLEYNALEIILQLKKPIDDICGINYELYYDDRLLSDKIDNFTKVYLTMLKNSEYTEFAFKKIIKEKDLKGERDNHGLWGILKNLLDQPIHDNRPVLRNDYDKIINSVTGLLISYYTSREKVVIRTLNQIFYLLSIDGKLDFDHKHLTKEAIQKSEMSSREDTDEDELISKKLEGLNRIFDNYLVKGPHLEERIFRLEYGNKYSAILENIKNKPVMKILKLVEGQIKYFVEFITDPENFILVYDNTDFKNYFEIKPEISDISGKYIGFLNELSGTRKKEIEGLISEPEVTPEEFINVLTNPELLKIAGNPKINFVRGVLQKIAEYNYRLAVCLNEIITSYYDFKEKVNNDKKRNFDFFSNSILKKIKNQKINKFFKKDDVILKEFLEAACSLAFHISHTLNNISIANMVKEREQLKSEIKNIQKLKSETISEAVIDDNFDENNTVLLEIDNIYKDSLTNLWKIDYIKDQVIPKLYDEKYNYKFEMPRFVFMGNIIGFQELNNIYGHENVDKFYSEFSRRIQARIEMNKSPDNLVIRYGAGIFAGYINDVTMMEAVEVIMEINNEFQEFVRYNFNAEYEKINYNFAIYEEQFGTNHFQNIEHLRKILTVLNNGPGKSIGFIKDLKYIITSRDYDLHGNLDRALVTIVS